MANPAKPPDDESAGDDVQPPTPPPAEFIEAVEGVIEDPEAAERLWGVWASYSGPFPLPRMLGDYDLAVDEGAERVFRLTEGEASHRRWMDKSFVVYRFLGLLFGFAICVLGLFFGYDLARNGQSAAGIALIIAELVALSAVFVLMQYRRRGD